MAWTMVQWLAAGGAAILLTACSDGGAGGSDKGSRSADEANASLTVAPTAQVSADAPLVVAFGDSLYAGYGLDAGEGFAPELQRRLAAAGTEAAVFNAGVSGDTTAAGLARLAFTLDGLPKKPALVIIGLGGNDMLRGIGPETTRSNLDAMLAELDRRGIPAMLTGMLAPPNLGEDYRTAFDAIYPELARKHDAALYPFFLEGLVGNRALFLPDGIHPTAEGIDMVAEKVAPVVVGALGDAQR